MQAILGPRVPAGEFRSRRTRYLLPTILLIVAAGLLIASYFLPYWRMTLLAPQYPRGLHVTAFLNRLEGDVREVDTLNHYIGMRPLNEAAKFERQTSAMLLIVLVSLIVGAVFIHSRWAAVLALPAVLFPAGFLLDLHLWMANFGQNLDPHAALSSSIKPFVPPVLGVGIVGQFKTVAAAGPGLLVAIAAAGLVLTALWFHRRAYKPLVDRNRGAGPRHAAFRLLGAAPGVTAALLAFSATHTSRAGTDPADIPGRFDLHVAIRAAAVGDTIKVPAGRYLAPLLIDKPLILIADSGAVIDGGGTRDIAHITAPDVTLRGFTLRGSGDSLDQENAGLVVAAPRATVEDNTLEDVLLGIALKNADASIVRGNVIRGKPLDAGRRGDAIRLWNSNRVRIENNTVIGARDVVIWYSKGAQVIGNTVAQGRYGLHTMYASDARIEDNRLEDNSVGVFLMYSRDVTLRRNVIAHNRGPSGYGLGLKDMDAVTAEENTFLANRVAVYLDNSPQRLDCHGDFARNVFAYNDIALAFLPAVRRNRFVENAFLENIEQIAILGSGDFKDNEFTLSGRGNYWSDYAGFDADGDGVGDVPYHSISLFENLMDREPKLRLFLYSPAQQAIELAARAFPVVRPQPKVSDAAPLMQAVAIAAQPPVRAGALPMSAIGGGLLGLGALAYGRLRKRAEETRTMSNVAADPRVGRGSLESLPCEQVVSDSPLKSNPAVQECDRQRVTRPIIKLHGLHKKFGRQIAVDHLDLEVTPGLAVALWGANGAGKTTIIKCILGLHPSRGTIRVGGLDARQQGKAARRLIGYVSQELSFYDDLTARETIRLFARLKRVPLARATEALKWVELEEHRDKRVGQLSGGMKQRLALAVALLADPPLLLLDEPTSNLDAAARRQFLALLIDLKKAGKTILYTTHRPEEVERLADRVIVLEHGRPMHDGAPADLERAINGGCRLRISLPVQDQSRATELLRHAGFDVTQNCKALLVRVPAARNAAPLVQLARAGMDIKRFDVEMGETQ
jgi:nitrous oxidase accessory protein